MAITLQKSTVVTVVGVSLAMLLAGCTTDQRYKRQVGVTSLILKLRG